MRDGEFDEVVTLITDARRGAAYAVNTRLIDLYWNIGALISARIASNGWGRGTVRELSAYVTRRHPGLRGFSAQNLWRMRQFHEAYQDEPKLSTLLRVLPWSANMRILTRTSRRDEREFYLRRAVEQRWSVRALDRQIDARAFERARLTPPRMSAALASQQPDAIAELKDVYTLEFLGLSMDHSESDLHGALLRNLGRFLAELGADFCFIGSQYMVQVGAQDFLIDLLFFHRGLTCLVALELKVREFRPEDLGKLGFYLEALDRDVRKPHERPSIGVLLCATKDDEVVEYALSRTLSPALVAEYQTALPSREVLRRKLHELYAQLVPDE